MKREWTGLGKVFAFTFRQKWNARRWRIATFLVAVLLLLLPAGILALMEWTFWRHRSTTGQSGDSSVCGR